MKSLVIAYVVSLTYDASFVQPYDLERAANIILRADEVKNPKDEVSGVSA